MTPLQRQRSIRPGAQVRILRRDISDFEQRYPTAKRRPHGRIVRIDGGYIYVRPNHGWARGRPPLELYDCEVEVLS